MVDLDDLEAKARAATQGPLLGADAAFIAAANPAANPAVILDLIAQLRAERKDRNSADRLAAVLYDLNRCEHGRHEGDVCSGRTGCDGPSLGNPIAANTSPTSRWKTADRQIGFNISGRPVVVPERDRLHDPAAWDADRRARG